MSVRRGIAGKVPLDYMIAMQSLEEKMGSMTIRQVDVGLKDWLRQRAAANGRSVESEVRHILSRERGRDDPGNYPAGTAPRPGENFVDHLIRITRPGIDLELPERQVDPRPPIDFG